MRLLLLASLALAACGTSSSTSPAHFDGKGAGELSGIGFVHYHPYPAQGVCACAGEYDFAAEEMMVAALSPSVHGYYGDSLCTKRRYAEITSKPTGKKIRVLVVDKGGVAEPPYDRQEQHIMDLSEKAFGILDVDGRGLHAGRIYVDWKLLPAPSDVNLRKADLAGQ